MKRLHTLGLALALLCAFTLTFTRQASAQANQKVVVIKKKTDANGQQVVGEVIVAEGEEAQSLLQTTEAEAMEDVIVQHPSWCRKSVESKCSGTNKNVNVNVQNHNGARTIVINKDGETETFTLVKGEELSPEVKSRLMEKGIMLNDGQSFTGDEITVHTFDNNRDFDFDFDLKLDGLSENLVALGKGFAYLGESRPGIWSEYGDINCAALGVYVSTSDAGGVYVNSIIGASGAEEAGLQSGDVIRYIDEAVTDNYGQLHDALSKYEPGDVVTVTYSRDGKEDRVESQLRAWKDFPSFVNSPHAHVSCDKNLAPEETVTRRIIVIKKDKAEETPVVPETVEQGPIAGAIVNDLMLSDFVAFPNPTDGKFSVQFSAEAVPTTVKVFDAAGKEVFSDSIDNFNGYYNRQIDLTDTARGALVLSVEQNGRSFTEQIVLH
jgi:hypothetical protein